MLDTPRIERLAIPDAQAGTFNNLTYYEWGNPINSRVALCVHGLTRNGRDFDFLAQALSNTHRVISVDMPGRGQSDRLTNPLGYSYPAYVATLTYFLKYLGLDRIDWIGTSMGGIIGMMMAGSWPGLIRALVLNDIGTVVSGAGMMRILSYPPPQSSCLTRQEAEAMLRERCAPFGIRTEAQWQHMLTYGIEEKNGCFAPTYDPLIMGVYAQDRTAGSVIADIDLWGLWPAVQTIPTLLIRGTESDLLTRDTAEKMRVLHPDLTLHEVANAGHAPSLMDAEEISIIKNWIASK